MSKGMLRMAYEAKDGKVKPSDKTEMINEVYTALVESESTDEWLAVNQKAPTRATVINWLTGATKTTNPYYMQVLSRVTGIAINDLF